MDLSASTVSGNGNSIAFLYNEKWKVLERLNDKGLRKHYAVSNWGRIAAYTYSIENGQLVAKGLTQGYRTLKLRMYEPQPGFMNLFVHKLVAEHFVERASEEHCFVIHLDHNKLNNAANNLKWATKEEMFAHQQNSPAVKAFRQKKKEGLHQGLKLTSTEVQMIKRLLADPNRKTRMKMIAKRFGISEMQLYRIKSGENWAHVKLQ